MALVIALVILLASVGMAGPVAAQTPGSRDRPPFGSGPGKGGAAAVHQHGRPRHPPSRPLRPRPEGWPESTYLSGRTIPRISSSYKVGCPQGVA